VRTLPFRMAAYPLNLITDFHHLRSALSRGEAELQEEERQVDSEVSRGCDAAGGCGVEKALFGSCELFGSQGLKFSHGLIVPASVQIHRGL
jgi:hypothetical protein